MLVEYNCKKILNILGIIWVSATAIHAQSMAVPSGTFRSPVDFDFRLSGGFNELRETHFHAGIDIKPSDSAKKDKIYSIASGFISRIRVSAGGYGYALYIDHPEIGYTSVYAHLETFSSRIDKLVKSHQIKNESFEVDLPLTPDILPVAQGEVIGIMGNTGFSFGEHLHFEVRDTKTEKPINPFIFGFTSPDKTLPVILNVAIHGLDENFHKICDVRVPLGDAKDGRIDIEESLEIPASRVGFAIETYDRANGSNNKMGIYGLHVYADDSLIYSFHMDKISFDQTRHITGFVDYGERKKSGHTYTLCYKYPGNDLEFLQKNGPAIVTLLPGIKTKIRIEAEDFFRNRKTIIFDLSRAEVINDKPEKEDIKRWVYLGQPAEIKDVNVKVSFGKSDLYRNIPFTMSRKTAVTGNASYQIHNKSEALKSPIDLMIRPEISYPALKDKAIIAWVSEGGKKYNCGGSWQEGYMKCRISEFGRYKVEYDTVAPTIKSANFRTKAGNLSKFRFELRDNFPVKGRDVNEISYKVLINGKFVISPYSLKSSVLEIPLTHLPAGEHTLEISVKDHSGNTRNFKQNFQKK